MEKKWTKKEIIIATCVIFVIGIACYWLYLSYRTSISDNEARAGQIRSELSNTRKELQDVTGKLQRIDQRLDTSINTVIRTERTIETVKERTESDARAIAESGELIRDSKLLIQEIRRRGEVEAK